MKKFLLLLFLLFSKLLTQNNFTKFVNPFIGTDGHGHTFPGATTPFGMVQLSPDTRTEGWDACSGYHYSDSSIIGFSQTHLSGTGIADYGDILVTPFVEKNKRGFKHSFSHKNENASPGFYSVLLSDENIFVELSATQRVGIHRFIFPKNKRKIISIDLLHGLGDSEVIESQINIKSKREITGFRRSKGWAQSQVIFFVAQFSEDFFSDEIFKNDSLIKNANHEIGKNLLVNFNFSKQNNKPIILKIALSHTSIEGARKNLESELPHFNFDKVKKEAEILWNKNLSKIKIENGSEENLTKFYTALYHSMIAPNIASDVDGSYRAMNGEIKIAKNFKMHTVFSLWDTFRALHPLLTIIDSSRTNDFVHSLLAKYDEFGALPVWELSSNETWCMIGYHSVPVLLDAFIKKRTNANPENILSAMINSAEANRFGLLSYKNFGFVRGEDEPESVSKTLEYAFDDWCISQMAKSIGKNDLYKKYILRAQNYKNIFDNKTTFVRPKINSMWVSPFEPRSVTFHFTEANSWQYTFFAPQDIFGLVKVFGSKKNFENKLDDLFNAPTDLIGREQADITGLIGQYAHGNEPSHNFAYLYNFIGAPWKTQNIVRKILDSLYTPNPNGLCGNDDCGQTSAWFVLSAIGIYPVTPGKNIYALCSPIFDKIKVEVGGNKFLEITSSSKNINDKFISSINLNGKEINEPFISFDDFSAGGKLHFNLSNKPNYNFGKDFILKNEIPDSLNKVAIPFFEADEIIFKDSLKVAIGSIDLNSELYYSINNNEFRKYQTPILINSSINIRAFAKNLFSSDTAIADFVLHKPIGKITLLSNYNSQYTGGGDEALIDGNFGKKDFRLGAWQGYEENNLEAVIDIEEIKNIESISLSTLQDINSWIFSPSKVEYSFSNDGINFTDQTEITTSIAQNDWTISTQNFELNKNIKTRYVKISAKNIGKCPIWHKGAGLKSWLFADEIKIKLQNK